VTADYLGDANYIGFGTSYITQTVNRIATTVNLTATQNPTIVQQPLSLIANVAPASTGALQAGGSVQFMDGGTSLGTVTLQNGSAQLPVTFTTLGTHSLTAVYSGDVNF